MFGGLISGLLGGVWFKVALVAVVLVAAAGGAFYWYFTYSQGVIRTLESNAAKAEIAVKIANNENASLRRNFKKQKEENAKLQKDMIQIEVESEELSQLLSRHNLTHLSKRKPGLIENRINKGTRQLFRDIEDASK
tara:strand:- start:723 stop:1130 length:408 start_codon:yes stop_codon:yes gene_type:complete